ncbi:PepSY-associated TM helix domain-containing protein [Cumulibacter soli]|uniref:PepSY-associated TM helix domain-containing protein n=1 Tax=Cumulibacter soli TaxID=2546344 RepID=UPI00141A3802|nr:PepSY domain-containing protein [Cumulibacter soli]
MNDSSPARAGSTGGLWPLVRRIHFYAGMFVGPFIFIAALTGAAYALSPTIERIVYADLLTVDSVEDPAPLEEQINNAQAVHPDMPIAQVWPATEPDDSTRVLLVDESLEDGRLQSVFVDPASGDVIGDEASYSGLGELPVRKFISETHRDLRLGEPGLLYTELAASWMWFVGLGGLILWVGRTRLRRALIGVRTSRRDRAARKAARAAGGTKSASRKRFVNLHGVTGTWLLVVMLGISATGLTWSTYAGKNVTTTIDALTEEPRAINTSLTGAQDHSDGGEHANHGPASGDAAAPVPSQDIAAEAQTVLDTAREEGLTGPLILYPPASSDQGWQASERWVEWRVSADAVSVDGRTGEVIDRLPFSELPFFSKLTSWGIYLHMGIMFGLPLQILLCLCGLGIAALVVMGYVMWWKRRPTRSGIAGVPGPNRSLSSSEWSVVALFLLTAGTFLPLLGISLLVMLIVDRALARRLNFTPTAPRSEASERPRETADA